MTDQLDAALGYAARRWPVLPVEPGGKRPAGRLVPHGLKQATTDPDVIRGWFLKVPDLNIGLRTGDTFDVLDIDGAEGRGSITRMCTTRDLAIPGGPWAVTGGDGNHLYMLPTGLGNRAKFLPGCDWRGRGGYVVAPPSLHASGQRYRWLTVEEGIGASGDPTVDAPLEPVPDWLVRLLNPPTPTSTAAMPAGTHRDTTAYAQRALDIELGRVALAPEGHRNHQLNVASFSLGQLVSAGLLDARTVVEGLLAAAQRAGLTEHEAERTIASGLGAGIHTPRKQRA